ncbi:putative bifunctional diguanylate cyclase/phosphodiesterase [Virgisporangium aurantiacum]|uniref:putative bifunctional diguanylate cyclase/phosphodiesterase n=1 Tax=Virgisporangium aurantiacum TaxID=175570 RepID=UPI00194EC1F0|nr:bifunctional diguanylate cyclase/phosphodiesterase [Virgisporangium aurantiacum]
MTRWIMVGYCLALLVIGMLYFAVPSGHMVFSVAECAVAVAAILVGVARNRPRRRAPWILIATAVAMFGCGDLINTYLTDVAGVADPFPSPADVFFLALCPVLAAGMASMVRSGATGRDRAALLDAFTVTSSLGLLAWIFLIGPLLSAPDTPAVEKAIAIAYPLSDILMITVLIRMATSQRRSPSLTLIVTGIGMLFVSDVLYGVAQLNDAYQMGGVVDLMYQYCYYAIGLAALHPSMADLTEPRVLRPDQVGGRRVAMLGLASLFPPAVLIVEELTGEVHDGAVIGVLCAVLFGLVVARLSGVVAVQRRSVARERGMRRAGAALLAAGGADEVVAAVRAAVADLLPPDTPHRVEVETGTPVPEDGLRMLRTGDGYVLRCALAGRRVTGRIDIGAADTALISLQEAAQVLAGQAALALDGLAANAEIVQRESETYFRTLVLNASDVIVIVGDDNRIRYASPSATAVFGDRDPVGAALPELVDPPSRDAASALLDAVRAGTEVPELTDWTMTGTGEPAQVEVACRDLRHEPTVAGVVVTLRDVTEHRRLERELLHRAYFDDLTGLPNRALFTSRLEKTVETGRPVGVVLVGLDGFKVINDTMGHDAGDELLVSVARRLVAAVSPRHAVAQHAVARIGGDEFAVLVELESGDDGVEGPAERALAAFGPPFRLPTAGVVTCHASVGTATTAEAGDSAQLLGRADIALAMAKTSGKGRVCRYEATLHTRILERLQLHAALDQAITNGEFRLVFQPVVALDTGRTCGFEALVRWLHPSRGTVPPLDFIGIAEESGLIVQLGEWVLRSAVAAAAQWPGPTYVAVNVSPRQFRAPGFVGLVQRALADAGLAADRLVLEITESLLLGDRDQDRIRSELDALHRSGVRIAIDDFGTGYSSLSYLHQMPVDLVKLDKSFVDTITTSPSQYDLVKGIIGLAHTLRLAVVAEGIETEDDRKLLIGAACEFGQGFLFARPMAAADALTWVTAAGSLRR